MRPTNEKTSTFKVIPFLLSVLAAFVCTSSAGAQAPGTFIPTSNMTTPRILHAATLLLNGQVLMTGGSSARPASAELYDPLTGRFTATANMITAARFGHTATLLSDGRVLIAAGNVPNMVAPQNPDGLFMFSSSPTMKAEVYDPATGIFTATGNMITGHPCATATLLESGKVLIAGGKGGAAASAELYDPNTGSFAATGAYATDTTGQFDYLCPTATLLPEGKVLITWTNLRSELYDPGTDTFSLTRAMPTPGYDLGYTATLLTSGKVLLAGGVDDLYFFDSTEVYDSSTGIFVPTGKMMRPRADHTATLLRDRTVLIAGSQLFPGATASAELYDPATGIFSATADMTSPRFSHTATLLMDGRILMAGGYTSYPATSNSISAELYVPSMLVAAQVVNDLRFDRTSVVAGTSYSVQISGSNLTPQTFFDVRFTAPGSTASDVVLNWQRGFATSHDVSTGIASGRWSINGVRAHEIETDHTGNFVPVSATITVSP